MLPFDPPENIRKPTGFFKGIKWEHGEKNG